MRLRLLTNSIKRAKRKYAERKRKMTLTSTKPHWGIPYTLIWRNQTALPEIYHFDEDGNYDARIRLTPDGTWEVWVGKPGVLVDDKVESEQEAKKLAEQVLYGTI